MEITIRKAQLNDADTIATFNQRMALETEGVHLPDEKIRPGVRAVLQDPNKGFYLVAEAEGMGVVGGLLITFEWSDWRNAPMWWFQSVFVVPEARGHKVFSRLYKHVMALAKAEGVKILRLYVERENHRAQKVYEQLGMTESHYLMYEVGVE